MGKHVIFGAGPIGRATAEVLARLGADPVLVSRSGVGPEVVGTRRVQADASDREAVLAVAQDASVIYNCLNPAYHRWPQDWPPMAQNLIAAAERSGGVLVTVSNLYGYGPVTAPITEEQPLAAPGEKGQVRAQMYADALAAHRAGRIRMVELRASDYVGPGAESVLGERVIPRLLGGRSVSVLGDPDQPHSWTYTKDVAELAVVAAADPACWGRPWHVPTNPPRTQREVIGDMAVAAGVPAPKVRAIPNLTVRLAGVFNPTLRELQETRYQFTQPFVLDSSAAQEHFGMAPTPWSALVSDTVAAYRPVPVP